MINVNVVQRNLCHFLLDCPNYETKREIMRKRLFDTCGIAHLDLNLLLDAKQDDRAGRDDVTTGKLFPSRGECLGLYRCVLIIFKRE